MSFRKRGLSKEEKRALMTGLDENNVRLNYTCPECGWTISLQATRCPKCGNKRPKDAYKLALFARNTAKMAKSSVYAPDRTVKVTPIPKKPHYAGVTINDALRQTYATEELSIMGIPKYYSADEYGRVYEAPVSYQPINGGAPVPITTPTKVIQTESITVPVNFRK